MAALERFSVLIIQRMGFFPYHFRNNASSSGVHLFTLPLPPPP
jgi:hypothetical protein